MLTNLLEDYNPPCRSSPSSTSPTTTCFLPKSRFPYANLYESAKTAKPIAYTREHVTRKSFPACAHVTRDFYYTPTFFFLPREPRIYPKVREHFITVSSHSLASPLLLFFLVAMRGSLMSVGAVCEFESRKRMTRA